MACLDPWIWFGKHVESALVQIFFRLYKISDTVEFSFVDLNMTNVIIVKGQVRSSQARHVGPRGHFWWVWSRLHGQAAWQMFVDRRVVCWWPFSWVSQSFWGGVNISQWDSHSLDGINCERRCVPHLGFKNTLCSLATMVLQLTNRDLSLEQRTSEGFIDSEAKSGSAWTC